MVTGGFLIGVGRWAAARYETKIRGVSDVLSPLLDKYLAYGWWIAAALVVLGLATVILAGRFTRSHGELDRSTRVAAAGLRVRPELLSCKTRWRGHGRKRHPKRIVIKYQSGSVDQQQIDNLREHLSTHWPAHYDLSWAPHRDQVTAVEVEPEVPSSAEVQGQDTPSLDPVATDPLGRARQVVIDEFGPLTEISATDVDAAGEPLSITVRYARTKRTSSELMRDRVGEEIARRLPGSTRAWIPSWDLQHDTLTLRRRPPLPTYVLHPYIERDRTWSKNGLVLPYATDGYGHAIGWDLNAATPHALIVGPTGTGKTVTIRAIATEAAHRGAEVWCGDPKRIELKGLRGWPGITRVHTTIPEIISMIEDAHALMMARYEALERNEILRDELTPLVIVLDEHLIFWAGANRHWKQTKEKGQTGSTHPVLDLLQDLIVLARSSRIHLCFGVQRPDAELFKQGGRDSVRHRVSLGKLSPEGALMMWNNAHTGTAIDMTIRGRATATTSTGEAEEVQTWFTPDPDPYILERDPNALTEDEKACLAQLRQLADHAQQQRSGTDDLSLLHQLRATEQATGAGESSADTSDAVPDDVQTAQRASDLSPGDTVILDLDGKDLRATIITIEISDDEETVTLEFQTPDGRHEILDLEAREALMVVTPVTSNHSDHDQQDDSPNT